jgi:LysR family transcriptional regulator, transcription activator of glutamate synthase operon
MELRQLVYFEAVARHGGFSRAAQQLRIAQPAVSAQIRRLETELGTALLERTTRRVSLTHAGELFLARARTVLDELDGARADLDELAAVRRGHLRIGATLVLASIDLPRSLARFHRRYPGVTLALRTGLIAQLLDDLDSGTVDVVVGPLHDDLPAGFVADPLAPENLVLITAPDRRLPPVATLAAVRDEPFVCLPVGSGLQALLVAAAAAEGFTPRIPFETHSPGSIRELVSAGLGVALLAESAAVAGGPAVQVHSLEPPLAHPPIGIIQVRGRVPSPAARAWQQYLCYPGGNPRTQTPAAASPISSWTPAK